MYPSDLVELRDAVTAMARALDAGRLGLADAVDALRDWTTIANAANAACALAAARINELGPPASSGASDASDYIAKQTGTTATKAKQRITTGLRLTTATRTRDQATAGVLSAEQADAIADAVNADPTSEHCLLATAERSSLGELRDECARRKAAADPDPDATHARIHANRRLRRYRDAEGAAHLHAVGTPEQIARIDHALKPHIDAIFRTAREAGVGESYEAYAFDALVALADDVATNGDANPARSSRAKPRYLGLLRVDVESLLRGRVDGEETCEIAGLGPIPVSVARGLLGESILKLVITRGVDVGNVTHLGRSPTAAQQAALLWQRPICTREGCGRRARLQIDHREEWQHIHKTELVNLDPLCHHDHRLKTTKGWALIDGQGIRPMVPPDDPRHPRHQLDASGGPS